MENYRQLIEKFKLRSRLRFDIESAHIWLDENRMMLMHARSLDVLRRRLLETMGERRARSLLFQMGFASGQLDAELAIKMTGEGDPYEVFKIGPMLHAFEGQENATITKADIDWENGIFVGEVECVGSWEAESHLRHFGVSESSACWMLAGHASGYVSQFFNRFIVFHEVKCVARGDDKCVIVGKPAEAWDDDDQVDLFSIPQLDINLLKLEDELRELRGAGPSHTLAGNVIGNSPGFRTAFDLIRKAANSPISVLLLGETGVGKEMFARWLHEHSNRADKPFVALNCGAIPHDLIEAELFGVQKGAYTGAHQSRPGRFERADGGTLFLDEVGDMSPAAQVKLLRVLQTGEIERLGDEQTRKVNVRLVAATNVDLQHAIAEGKFRADLYYRLATYPVTIPPLRDRKGDIPLLAAELIKKYSTLYEKKVKGLSDRAMKALLAHPWHGNVRELENLIERGILLAPDGGLIEIEHLFSGTPPPLAAGVEIDVQGQVSDQHEADTDRLYESLLRDGFDLERHEERLLDMAVKRAGGNLTQAARTLGITRRQLAYRINRNDTPE
ncbi:MAG TPA: sigma 54-interacting transcriptional regulator [Burkholderiaceae bacterium]|nr:sigma 54-interacting transcriptional regulator [Burkholderiaceae bacterium]